MKTACLFAIFLVLLVVDWNYASESAPCEKKEDCKWSECCRRSHQGNMTHPGKCHKFGMMDNDCKVNITQCATVCSECPCARGFYCMPNMGSQYDGMDGSLGVFWWR
ncbi:hypothetical protein ACOMHN_035601 [Nucella lapillus]